MNLANLLALDEPARAAALYRTVLEGAADFAPAHRGMCSLAAAQGDAATAALHRAAGYARGPFGRRPYFGEAMPLAVLALVSTDGGNIPLDALLDERRFLVHEVFVEAYCGEALPPHELIVNAIADADRSAAAIVATEHLLRDARVPVINAPRAVAATGRITNAERLAAVAGVRTPQARRLDRSAPAPERFPLILRVPGLHMGRGMTRIDDARTYAAVLRELPDRDDLIAIPYVETRSPDGAWRKYRVMAIDGVLYPLHLAIAQRWDVHYFSSAMWDRADYRAEEARFLADPIAALGAPAWSALANVRDALGLDYAGIDFALDRNNCVVIFEANAAMTILRPDPDERFRYREPSTNAIAAALARMFEQRVKR